MSAFTNLDLADLSRRIGEMALSLGFAAVGIAPAAPTRWERVLREWLGAGHHGEMDYLERELHLRLDPRGHLPGTRAFIMVADQYAARGQCEDPPLAPGAGRIARYARGRDYHGVMKRRLHRLADTMRAAIPGADFRSFVDTAPVLERELAVLAGLGWQAKNTMMIHPRLGSYLLLGGAATNLPLVPLVGQEIIPDACGTCTRCIDACPTGAITPYKVDGSRCISYLTIEQRGAIEPAMHEGMGAWVYGCDVCQEVCPHNSARAGNTDVGTINAAYRSDRDSLDLLDVLGWDAARRTGALIASPMKRATLAMMKRNALIAAGDWLGREDHPALRERVRQASLDPHEPDLVRSTAAAVLAGLASWG